MHSHLRNIVIPTHIVWLVSLFTIDWRAVIVLPIALLLWVVIGGIGVEIGYHRILSHKHFSIHSRLEKLIYLLGMLGLQGSPLFWRALHVGYHHAYPDTKRDFHSPVNGGFFNAYVGYVNKLDKMRFLGCREIMEQSFYKWTQKLYVAFVWLILAGALVFSPQFGFALLTAMIMAFHQTALVNTLCHSKLGYTNFETNDLSRNVRWLSWLTFGLALHNNHHKFPGAADFAVKDDETDVGFTLAKFLRFPPGRK
jgi:fatty-acid desaturase